MATHGYTSAAHIDALNAGLPLPPQSGIGSLPPPSFLLGSGPPIYDLRAPALVSFTNFFCFGSAFGFLEVGFGSLGVSGVLVFTFGSLLEFWESLAFLAFLGLFWGRLGVFLGPNCINSIHQIA